MEVRCAACQKLFRVSDDKITGAGIKFSCSRCGEAVRITREDFEHYKLSQEATSILDTFVPKPPKTAPVPVSASASEQQAPSQAGHGFDFDLSDPATAAASMGQAEESSAIPDFGGGEQEKTASQGHAFDFDLSDPATAAASMGAEEQTAPAFGDLGSEPHDPAAAQGSVLDFDLSAPAEAAAPEGHEETPAFNEFIAPTEPEREQPPVFQEPESTSVVAAPVPEPKKQPQPEPEPKPKPVQPAPPAQKTQPVKPATPAQAPKPAEAAVSPKEVKPAPERTVLTPQPLQSSGMGKKIALVVVVLLILGGAAFGLKSYFLSTGQKATDVIKTITSPDGLQIVNATGTVDPATADIVIAGTIQNTTDKPKPGWYCVVELYDAQGAVLAKGRMLNGKQFYSRRDYDILAKRGQNIQDVKLKSLQEQGVIIPAKSTVNFEIRIMEPPTGVANFTPMLLPFDPVQLFKEMAAEQK